MRAFGFRSATGTLALAAMGWLGCGDAVPGDNIRTAGLVMLADVVDDGSGQVQVSVEFKVGGRYSNTYAALEPEDELWLDVDGSDTRLSQTEAGLYEVNVPRPLSPDASFTIELVRAGHADARANMGILPAAFELVDTPGEAPVSRTEGTIELRWEPVAAGGEMLVEIARGRCFAFERFSVSDDVGMASVQPGQLKSLNVDARETCGGVVRALRTRFGQVDSALDRDSVLRLRQVREAEFSSGP